MSRATRLRLVHCPRAQLGMHARAAVAPSTGLMDSGDLDRQALILPDPRCHRPPLGGVEARP
jgi:hypothetical protein